MNEQRDLANKITGATRAGHVSCQCGRTGPPASLSSGVRRHQMPLPQCPATLPNELETLIAQFGRAWAASEVRPVPTREVTGHWQKLISDWIASDDLPLYIRKHNGDRGSEVIHPTGRRLVPTDNSAAHWSFTLACEGITPDLNDIHQWIAEDLIPIVMIQKSIEKPKAKYHCSLGKKFNVNLQGWKLGHILPVGLNTRQSLVEIQIKKLEAQFQRLIDPSNMFVIPLAWSGLAEVDSVIQAVSAAQK